jgi:uncharacterized membrane protein
MAAVAVEPISPELVLVCPELREQAIAMLPDYEWQIFVAQARVRMALPPAQRSGAVDRLRAGAAFVFEALAVPLVGLAILILATSTLTLVADLTR